MKIFDLHCDALLKLNEDHSRKFQNSSDLEVNLQKLGEGEIALQLFAVFIDPRVPSDEKFQKALEQIDLFHTEVIGKNVQMKKITNWEDIKNLKKNEIGAMLTLEGADAFGNDLMKLRTFYQLGVKSIGLTWNNSNLCADGVGEGRQAGLTDLGVEVTKMNNEQRVWSDVSHLSVQSFWDIMEIADYPIATHSNSKVLCQHRRNLYDDQAKAIFKKNGFIGMVFNPPFINNSGEATITDLIKHIDHFCQIGGVNHVALGSDFDGIKRYVKQLEHSANYQNLINELLKHYKEEEVRGFAYKNVLDRLPI